MRDHAIKDQFGALFAGVVAVVLCVALTGCAGGASSGAADKGAEQGATATEGASDDVGALGETDDAATDAADAADAIEVEQDDDAIVVLSSGELDDGTYDVEAETDSSMFRAESCTLVAKDGAYTASLSLPGEGFSRLYFGTAEQAEQADDADIADYYLNDDGKYTFDLAVEELDKELPIAAFGQRRDTWYDHTITFHAPSEE